jgi:hypothetical protein
MLRRTVFALGVATLVGGCDHLGSAAGPNVLHGGVRYSGGPAPGVDPTNHPGKVSLRRDGDKVAEQTVREGQEFTFSVERGTYSLAVDLGDYDCVDEVRVDRARVHADVTCAVK